MKKIVPLVLFSMCALGACGESLVYEVTMKVKTTVPKTGEVKSACCVGSGGSTLTYRKQGTITVRGLIWARSCSGLMGTLTHEFPGMNGCYFWNMTDGQPITGGRVTWPLLHRIDNGMKKVEGVMELKANDWQLLCAGYGRADDVTETDGMLRNLNGNFAGWRTAPTWVETVYGVACPTCPSGLGTVQRDTTAAAWSLCNCALPSPKTLAFGTWKVKYNRVLSQAYTNVLSIRQVYGFPPYVTELK